MSHYHVGFYVQDGKESNATKHDIRLFGLRDTDAIPGAVGQFTNLFHCIIAFGLGEFRGQLFESEIKLPLSFFKG